jgi:nanoRNase/pAp phosphatase (c-di-AMP/oligoRNAs hydrolase)
MTSNRERIRQLMTLFSGNCRVLIVINADPDAIATAMAMKRILWRRVSEVAITHFNPITRPDNLAMIEYTESGLVPMERIDKAHFDRFIIVDSQPDHNEAFDEFDFDVIVDHHPFSAPNAQYSDVRPGYGACSTIATEYLRSLKIKPSAKLAAALMLGIKTDTASFTRQVMAPDIRAFHFLHQFANMNIVTKVERSTLTQADLDFLSVAIKNRQVVDNRVFYHAGVCTKPDELVMVADTFLVISGVNWSVVSGVYKDKLVVILRNDGLRKSAGKTAKEAFGKFGSAGGHKTMARGELDMKLIYKQIRGRSHKAMGQWIMERINQTAGKKIE